MSLPTIEELASQLEAVSGAQKVDPDQPLQHIADVDSLDLMEWLYGFQNQYPHIPADESLFADIDDTTTLRVVYERIVQLVPAQA
jgi:acyl carrier protein